MIANRYEQPRLQSDFYRHQYHKMLKLIMILSCCIFLLILGIVYYLLNPGPARFYASTTTGQIITMNPVKH